MCIIVEYSAMDSGLTINRNRLEQYPLFTHPLLRAMGTIALFSLWGLLMIQSGDENAPMPVSTRTPTVVETGVDLILDRTWLAILLGFIVGASAKRIMKPFYIKGIDATVNGYFCAAAKRTPEGNPKQTRLMVVAAIVFIPTFWALTFLVTWYGERLLTIYIGFAVGYVMVTVPMHAALHREILRRRRIALAWEGVEYPDNRLVRRQKAIVGLSVAGVAVYSLGIGYMTYLTIQLDISEQMRAFDLYMEGQELGESEVAELNRILAESPDHHEARMMLIGYHTKRARHLHEDERHGEEDEHEEIIRAHAIYFVQHIPGHALTEEAITSMPIAPYEPRYLEFADLWREQVSRHPDDPDVYWNAARFFIIADKDYRKLLLRRGRRLAPKDDRWWEAIQQDLEFEYEIFDLEP